MPTAKWSLELAKTWKKYRPPSRPSPTEVKVFEKYIKALPKNARILLLGSTPEIRNLAAKYKKNVIVSDWSEDVSKALKLIVRKSAKEEFKKQDPHALLFNISRRNGFPILTFKATPDLILLGHEFGFVSIWNKKTLKLHKSFFVHGKHITGIDIG